MFGIKILEERKSKYNGNLKVVRSFGLGTYIQSNGLTQSGGIVESIWKQTLRKVSFDKKKKINCLILGLGGGTVVKLILQKYPNAKISGVDIDPVIVELGKKYLRLNNEEVDIEISDAFSFIRRKLSSGNQFDLVIVDLYNGDQFPKKFESLGFISLVHGIVKKGGVVIFNRLYFGDKKKEAEGFGKKLKKVFKNVRGYHPIANIMFVCSS